MGLQARDGAHLPQKLEAVLVRLCRKLEPLTKTKAVKLPYLADVVASAVLGRAITEGTHETWELGVVTREAWTAITHATTDLPFSVEPHPYSETGFQIRLAESAEISSIDALSPDEAAIVDWVADRFGRMDAVRLGQITKALNSERAAETWGSNHRARLGNDAYARLSSGWIALSDQLPRIDLEDRSKWLSESLGRDQLRRALEL